MHITNLNSKVSSINEITDTTDDFNNAFGETIGRGVNIGQNPNPNP